MNCDYSMLLLRNKHVAKLFCVALTEATWILYKWTYCNFSSYSH